MFKVLLVGGLEAKGVIFAVEGEKISTIGTFTNSCSTMGLDIGFDFSAEASCRIKRISQAILVVKLLKPLFMGVAH